MSLLSTLSKSQAYKNILPSLSRSLSGSKVMLNSCGQTENNPENAEELKYRVEVSRGPGDVHELKHVLKDTFFLDEPSIKLFGLTGEEYCGELIDVMMQGITYEESLLAKFNETNEIVGFALNGEYDHDKFESEVKRWTTLVKESRNKKLLALWSAMSRQFNFKCVRPSARAMEVYYLGVVPNARQQGLAKRLVRESIVLAKLRGYGLVQVVCTSDKSARICKSLGMKQACTVEYDSLIMPSDGRPVVTKPPPPPDENVKIYYETI